MDDTITKIILGFLGTAWMIITGWTHHRASAAHTKIDDRRKETKADITKVYDRIKVGEVTTERCRQEIDREMNNRMTEPQIKDFVDREVKSLQRSVDSVNASVKEVSGSVVDLLSKMQVLLERDNRHRKND